MLTPAKVRRLKSPAVSSWSLLKRSSDSARTIESPAQRIAHQRLEARTQQCRAGDCLVSVLLADRPALSLGVRTAHAQLIGDRRVSLIV